MVLSDTTEYRGNISANEFWAADLDNCIMERDNRSPRNLNEFRL